MRLENKNPQQDIGQKNPYPSEGIDKKSDKKFDTEIGNYNTLINSSPSPKLGKIEEQLGKVANSMKEDLGIPDATISLKRKNNNGTETITGTISIPGKPTNVSVSVRIDSDDGSIVIGKPIDGKTTEASFNLGVRLDGSKMKENFEKIKDALQKLPEGFSAIGITDKGEVVAYNGESNGMDSPGTKGSHKLNVRIVSVDNKGRPVIKTPTELEVNKSEIKKEKIDIKGENSDIKEEPKRLRIGINSEVSFVEPFPASFNERKAQKQKAKDYFDDFLRKAANGLLGGGNEKGIIEKGKLVSGG